MLKVKMYREEKGWTQRKLSEVSGVSRSRISEIENDGYNITLVNLCSICKALEVAPNDLIEARYWRG